MSDLIFPVADVDGHRLISTKGQTSSFYELEVPDLEQMDQGELSRYFYEFGNSLNQLDKSSYFKFSKIRGRSYLETNSESFSLHGLKHHPSNKHLESFFGDTDLYSDVSIFDDYILVNGEYLKILSVKEFGSEEITHTCIPIDAEYIVSFKSLDNAKSVSRLERIRTSHLASFLKTKRDLKSESAYDQAQGLLGDLISSKESIFLMEMYFLVRAQSLMEVNNKVKELVSCMGQRGVKLFLEGQAPTKLKSGLGTIFSELIPGATPELNKRSHFNKTSHLKYLLPVSQSKLMEGGIPFHDECDQEVFLNPFSSEIKNKNMLVTGLSGSGKSVFVNKLVHKLIDKHPTVILDKGGSFKKLTDYHGGVVLSGGINPMQFKDPIFIREFILSVVDKNEFTKLCRGKLLFLIKEFLASSQEQSFKRLLKFLESEFAGISYYFEDIKDYISENNASEVPILYVDVESYPKNMIPPIIIFILGYFKNHKAKEKILVFDECWSFLADHSEYIDECFRTFRKSGAFPVAISQGIDDFKAINSSLSNSITNNSFFKIYFPQESRSEGDLTTFDRSRIKDLHFKKNVYSDCYLKSSDNKYRKIIRNYLTPLELELFHTEPGGDDHLNLFLENNKQYFKSTKDAIDAFVGLKYAQDTNSFNDANSHIWN